MMRIDKYLSECGCGTRSEVKKMIKAKHVTVNGEILSKPETKIAEESDVVCVKGRTIVYEKYEYYILHKPSGCVTARQDSLHKTVMEYFPETIRHKGIAPVGRLDLDTEGFLLFTNDGALTHHLLSPSHHIPKTYYAVLDKDVPQDAVKLFEEGIDIGDEKPTLPAKLVLLSEREAELIIEEGRFHQVKRMFEAVGCKVTYLKRLSMGSFTLGELEKGSWRKLSAEEIILLKNE